MPITPPPSLLTSGEIHQLSGLGPSVQHLWVSKGVVSPAAGGEGHGSPRHFTAVAATALTLAARLRDTERGSSLAFAKRVVAGFEKMGEARLIVSFERGDIHFTGAFDSEGLPVLRANSEFDWIDVRAIYQKVKSLVAEREGK